MDQIANTAPMARASIALLKNIKKSTINLINEISSMQKVSRVPIEGLANYFFFELSRKEKRSNNDLN
jgi:hypothetical protein